MKNKTALKLIAELEKEIEKDVYTDPGLSRQAKDCAHIGRVGGLQLAILKIKLAFGIEL